MDQATRGELDGGGRAFFATVLSLLARMGTFVSRFRIAIVVVAVVVLGGGGLIFKGNTLVFQDEREYMQLGSTLAHAGVFGYGVEKPTAYRPPAYALFTGVLSYFSPQPWLVRLVQVVVWGLGGLLVYRIVAGMAGAAAGGFGLLMWLGYPLSAYMALLIYPQLLCAIAILICLDVLFSHWGREVGWASIFLLTAACGFATMAIPVLAFMVPIFCLVLFIWLRAGVLKAVTPLVVVGVLIMGWVARNAIVLDIGPTFSTSSGFVLLLGNSENTTASSANLTDISRYERPVSHLPIHEQNRLMTQHAMDWITDNPWRFAKLYVAKFANHFHYVSPTRTDVGRSGLQEIVLFVSYYGLLALVLMRLTLLRSYRLQWQEVLLLALYIGAAFVYALFFTKLRYRMPFDPLLMLVAATFVGHLFQRFNVGGDLMKGMGSGMAGSKHNKDQG